MRMRKSIHPTVLIVRPGGVSNKLKNRILNKGEVKPPDYDVSGNNAMNVVH